MVQIPRLLLSMALACSLAAIIGTNAAAAPAPGLSMSVPVGPFLLKFDDTGNGLITVDGGSPATLGGMLLADPANTDCPSCLALTYLLPPLPESVATGDVAIFDPVSEGGGISSWLRFTDDSGDIAGDASGIGGRMIFYADVPFPDNIGTVNSLPGPTKMINADGTSSFDYQPAGVPFPNNNEYIGVIGRATTVPQPGSLALLGSCVVAMGLISRRRRQQV